MGCVDVLLATHTRSYRSMGVTPLLLGGYRPLPLRLRIPTLYHGHMLSNTHCGFYLDYMESIVSTSEIMEPPGMSRSSNPVNVQRREGYHTHNPSYIGFQWILVWLFNKGNSSTASKGLL